MLEVYLHEYNQLKSEQTARIGFRDNLLYVTLAAQGAIFSFTLLNHNKSDVSYYPLLIIPVVCLILGWAYLVNDDKISEIGRYIRYELHEKIVDVTEFNVNNKKDLKKNLKNNIKGLKNRKNVANDKIDILFSFGWEVFHRSDQRRKRRKIEQLLIDILTFVISGIASLIAFWFFISEPDKIMIVVSIIELVFLLILGREMCIYADTDFGK